MSSDQLILIVSFGFIALVYSSVGFGGGSSYLALLGVLALPYELIRPTALLCNIVVVTGGCIIFYRQGYLNLRKDWPFVISSIPLAYVGGMSPITERTFFVTLGFILIASSILLWVQNGIKSLSGLQLKSDHWYASVGLGGGIGFLSGLVSIGGGIFLSPVLHLLNWEHAKRISALASFFILVNSVSGLAGQYARGIIIDWSFAWPLLLVVLAGGQVGSRIGSKVFNPMWVKRVTALLILAAAINILNKHW